ncbi:MAG: KH domain-containing protein [Candidatus Zixiibacteriota bacterium]|nr:MAG: KH domain-containing protein [candidate division Zixibacteria bacterium]
MGLKEYIEHIVKPLVENPDKVEITEIEGERTTVYELRVGEGDLGKVIGKQGKTARAIRTLLAASAARLNQRAVLEILE